MNFIEKPNLPQGPVTLAVVDGRLESEIEAELIKQGLELIKTNIHKGVYEAISFHPDVMLHHLLGRDIVYAPGTHSALLSALKEKGFRLIKGSAKLSIAYPGNIAYNVARVGNLAFHNLNYTDPLLKEALIKMGVDLVHVKQGYSKCSISIINERSIITSDKGIAEAAINKGVEALLIESDENISLPGLKGGFLGGSSGLIDKNKWVVTRDIKTLKSAKKIQNFLDQKNMQIISLVQGQPIDIGSIIPLLTKNGL